jgi:hypothetical protein
VGSIRGGACENETCRRFAVFDCAELSDAPQFPSSIVVGMGAAAPGAVGFYFEAQQFQVSKGNVNRGNGRTERLDPGGKSFRGTI